MRFSKGELGDAGKNERARTIGMSRLKTLRAIAGVGKIPGLNLPYDTRDIGRVDASGFRLIALPAQLEILLVSNGPPDWIARNDLNHAEPGIQGLALR